ncbi:short-chain fatty acid transporter [Robertkochia sediminum]|uniref:short-chain fatty acid transporter n=1 Tax=Robertkochia sediminum TaxID=2785326 RepID=UPI0019328A7A|nr:TIGR00366 family protein [Robertkochia sediminum]MBL7473457.1 short-chain fatty acid transporter [Robertkochia sediminum]
MIERLGQIFTDAYRRFMPDAFVFAIVLTVICALAAMIVMSSGFFEVLEAWYQGFWLLLEFGMQMVLLVITGYSIALAPFLRRQIDKLAVHLKTPRQVYFFVTLTGTLLCLVSWGWIIITAVLARELALRVKGVHYPYLIACVYCSFISWVTGLSSSIPLLLNTQDNFLIEAGILQETIPTGFTLGSTLNMAMLLSTVILVPTVMWLLRPGKATDKELTVMLEAGDTPKEIRSIAQEADATRLPGEKAWSDRLNHSVVLQYLIALSGVIYLGMHFYSNGGDLNLNIMIFIFLMLGMLLHKTPMRYGISMKRASSNVSAILFQFPFYAGIMGIMMYTGLARELGELMAAYASPDNFPVFAFLTGGLVNFAIPSAGGEFAVIGPSVLQAVNDLGISGDQTIPMIARSAMAIAYGESLSNLLQPFFLLLVIPVMAAGIKIQARDIMGFLVIPFMVFMCVQLLIIYFWPLAWIN